MNTTSHFLHINMQPIQNKTCALIAVAMENTMIDT